jgi:hypothetical protein
VPTSFGAEHDRGIEGRDGGRRRLDQEKKGKWGGVRHGRRHMEERRGEARVRSRHMEEDGVGGPGGVWHRQGRVAGGDGRRSSSVREGRG